MRALIIHKASGRAKAQLKRLMRYCLRPGPQSAEHERVLGVINGLDLNAPDAVSTSDIYVPKSAELIAAQLGDDVPEGRRLYRHVVVSLAASKGEDLNQNPIGHQVQLLGNLVRRYAAMNAPGYRFVGVIHGDHQGEQSRGLHAHIIFKNADAKGKALEWTRHDLSQQQGMAWAAGLDVVATRGTGVARQRGVPMPYPKSKGLDAAQIGKLNNEQLELLIKAGNVAVGRRDKSGAITSVIIEGRRIRLSTARALAARDYGMAEAGNRGAREIGTAPVHGVVDSVAIKSSPTATNDSTRRDHRRRFIGVGIGVGRTVVERCGVRKKRLHQRAVRGAARRVTRTIESLASQILSPLERL